MKRIALGTVLVFALLCGGCDPGQPQEPPPTIERVQLRLSPTNHTSQTIAADRVADDSFRTSGQLLLPPGEYVVYLAAYDEEGESATTYLANGPNYPILRYRIEGPLVDRVSLRQGPHPTLAPLDSILAPLGRSTPLSKTTPVPRPRFLLTVADTTGATGTIRLVYERYESFTAYRRGEKPTHTEFDMQFRLRTVSSTMAMTAAVP